MINEHQFVTNAHEENKVIVYEKGSLLFIFNFHASNSYEDFKIGTTWSSDHFVLFETDDARFGGHDRLRDAHGKWIEVNHNDEWDNRPNSFKIYLPNRCAIVLCPLENAQDFDVPEMPQLTQR